MKSLYLILLLAAALPVTSGCADEACLVTGENCTSDYVEAEYGDGRGCCDDLSCSAGPSSGVLVCR